MAGGRAVLSGAAILVAVGACSGGGPAGVTGLQVGGSWIEVSTLIEDECDSGLPPTSTAPLTIVPDGNRINFVYHLTGGDFVLAGTFNPQTGAFTLSFSEGSVTGVQAGSFSSTSSYTSESEIVVALGGGETCTVRTSEVGQRA